MSLSFTLGVLDQGVEISYSIYPFGTLQLKRFRDMEKSAKLGQSTSSSLAERWPPNATISCECFSLFDVRPGEHMNTFSAGVTINKATESLN